MHGKQNQKVRDPMKICVFGQRPYDEQAVFSELAGKYPVELVSTALQPSPETLSLAEGCDAVSIVAVPMPGAYIRRLHEMGVKMISTRTIGYDHVDLNTAKELGIHVSNASYSPYCVAEYTVMLMLMTLRNMKRILQRADIHDFSLEGTIGRNLGNCTVGIIGPGKIGQAVMKLLTGFGCEVLFYGRSKVETLAGQQVSLNELLARSDVISLHMPLTDNSFHMLDREAFGKMKDGAVLINTARGGLVDTEALIEALESGKLGGAGLDVLEQEGGLYHFDKKNAQIAHRHMSILKDMPNVVFSPHMAFYAREAVGDMAECSIRSILLELEGKENPWRII